MHKSQVRRSRLWCAALLLALANSLHAATLTVTKTADTNDGVCDADCSLREAIIAANAAPGADMIILPAGTYTLTIAGANEESAATGDLDITGPLTINGAAAPTTVVDGGGLDRVFHIQENGILGFSATISGVTIQNGNANFGGGVFNNQRGDTTIASSTIRNNTATFGGGLFQGFGSLTLKESTINGNIGSGAGGGIGNNATMMVINTTISGNSTDIFFANGGGGVSNGGMLTLVNSTISNNLAPPLSAVGDGILNQGSLTLQNTIVAGNGDNNCFGTITSAGHNLDSGNDCGLAGPGDLPNTNPLLGALQDNGGPTLTHALLPGSPAIDAGSNVGCPTADQRAFPRPVDGDSNGTATCDIGAYEFGATLPGDLDSDGDVDRTDQSIFRTSLNKCTGDGGFITETDYNASGCTDLADYRTWFGFYQDFNPPQPCTDCTRSARSLFNAPAAPTLTISFGLKQLLFDWSASSGATHYRLFENPDGVSGFTQVGTDLTTTNTVVDIAVHRHDWANARYLVEACNSLGCTASNEVTTLAGMLQTIGYFKASNTETTDGFSETLGSIALSADGTTLAVGAVEEDSAATGIDGNQADNSALQAGAVYVFTHAGGTWSQQAYVKASNTGAGDIFGSSLALSADGNTLAVGAFREDSAATGINGDQSDNSATDAGTVYVFTRSGSAWSQQAYVKASNTDAGDGFGGSVALSADGNTLAVGACCEDSAATGINGNQADNSVASAGAAYVFTRSGSAWSQQAYVKASNTDAGDGFGGSVALSADGNTLGVGATGEDSAATGINGSQGNDLIFTSSSGAAYVFTRAGSTWSQQAYVKASNTGGGDIFGRALSLSADGNTLAVGADGEGSAATGINGNQADNSIGGSAGAAYLFTRSGSTWSQQAYVKASNTGRDSFGTAVSLSADGNTLAVGACCEESAATGINGDQTDNSAFWAGAVYVYTRSGSTWSQQAYVKTSNTGPGDFFGLALSLSADGNTLAVGAPREDSAATGIDGNQADNSALQAGAVYLY